MDVNKKDTSRQPWNIFQEFHLRN